MKRFLFLMAMIVVLCSADAQISRATLTAGGLTCSMCSKAVYQSLIKMNSVETVKVNIKESSYDILFKKGVPVTPDDIRKAVEGAGFSVVWLRITVNFNNLEVKNDTHATIVGENFHFLHITPQTLNGDVVLTLVDRNFTSAKEYKKYGQYTTMKCYSTGVMEPCCANKTSAPQRIYHVTI